MRRVLLVLLLAVAACDYWALSINSDGLIHVTVLGGDGYRPRDGYRIRVIRGPGETSVVNLPESGVLQVDAPPGAQVTLALMPPAGCIAAASEQSVRVGAGSTATARFELACGG